jgi:hypothetical protein
VTFSGGTTTISAWKMTEKKFLTGCLVAVGMAHTQQLVTAALPFPCATVFVACLSFSATFQQFPHLQPALRTQPVELLSQNLFLGERPLCTWSFQQGQWNLPQAPHEVGFSSQLGSAQAPHPQARNSAFAIACSSTTTLS